MTSSPLPGFLAIAQPKTKILLSYFVCGLLACISITYIPFSLDKLKISDFIGNYFWKIESLNFGGQNRKIPEIWGSHFVERKMLPCLAFLIASFFKTEHSSSLQTFAVLGAKMASLKRHFLKNFQTDFSEILVAGVKLMLGKVLKVLRRYLPSFLSYRENPAGGGRYSPPPQRGAI